MAGWEQKLSRLWKKEAWRFLPASLHPAAAELNNPGCGWYRIYTAVLHCPLEEQIPQWQLDPAERLALIRLDISYYRSRDLDHQSLEVLRQIIRFFAQNGKELIVRGVYDIVGTGVLYEPSRFDRVSSHISQLARVLAEFPETVFIYQGVLLGSWGEMHTSRFLTKPRLRILIEQLERLTGEHIFLSVRRPVFYRMLRKEQTFLQSPERKIGLFDDAILGSDTDLGTFGWQSRQEVGWEEAWLPEEELEFEKTLCALVPHGGEAILPESEEILLNTAVARLQRMGITYLNNQHDPRLMQLWREQTWISGDIWNGMSGYDYIGRHLGSRFQVEKAAYYPNGKEGSISVTLQNVGFASCCQQLELSLNHVLPDGEIRKYSFSCDLRGLGHEKRITADCTIAQSGGELYLQLHRCSDGQEIQFGTESEKNEFGLYLGSIERN